MPDDSDSHFYLTDVSPRDKPWDEHRTAACTVEMSYEIVGYDRYAERIRDCSKRLVFALSAETETEFKLRLTTARFCRVRFCPVCQWRRSLMWRARFFEAMPDVVEDFPKARYIFLTLTVRNCEIGELKATLQTMTKAWDRLCKRVAFPAIGFVRSTEVTRSATGEAHPHFHCLLMVEPKYFDGKNYLSQESWRSLWQSCLRSDYLPVVNVKAVRRRPSKAPQVDPNEPCSPWTWPDDITCGILETLKYSVKVSDLTADPLWLMELTKQLHKTRAVVVGGVLKEYLKQDEPEDLISEDETSKIDESLLTVFDYMPMLRRYIKSAVIQK